MGSNSEKCPEYFSIDYKISNPSYNKFIDFKESSLLGSQKGNSTQTNKNNITPNEKTSNCCGTHKDKKLFEIKKYNLNILYYDEHLINNEENTDNYSFFEMNNNGTFYGCHNFYLFQIICQKIIGNKKEFILISSGSSAKMIFDYCSNIKEIREYYIYCFDKEKYLPLIDKYPKLEGIYNSFKDLKDKLYTIKETQIDNIISSNLIYFEDYSRIYIKLHYEFIRKYSLYKLLKSKNCNEYQFLSFIKKEYPYFLNLAKQIFPNKYDTIKFFIENTSEKLETLEQVFKCDDDILDDNIESYIHNYTKEGFYYKYLNKFLREGNFEAFRILSSHISKFIFKLYEYREKKLFKQKQANLYRRMYLNPKEIKLYQQSCKRVICYPSFTSTSIKKNGFTPNKYNNEDELVLLIIEQNNTKSTVLISQLSEYPKEEEYLFLPFSFFKILKVELKKGTDEDPHIIYLLALDSDKPIEEMFTHFFKNETDALNPEGLDLLILNAYKSKILFNPIYLSKNK